VSRKPIRMQVRCMRHDAWYYPSEGCPLCKSDHTPAPEEHKEKTP